MTYNCRCHIFNKGLDSYVTGSAREISTTRMFESLEKLQESSSDEEFYDAEGNL